MIGEFLYGLTPQEAVSAPVLQPASDRRNQAGQALAIISFVWEVPFDKVLLLTNLDYNANSGGTGSINTALTHVLDPAQNILYTPHINDGSGLIQFSLAVNFGTPVILMPKELLTMQVFFSDAVNNSFIAAWHGILLPKGTLQYGALRRVSP